MARSTLAFALRATLWACASCALAAGTALGQVQPASEPDLLDQVRRREKVAAEKVEMDLRIVLKQIQKITNDNPAKAVEQLKRVLAGLEAESVLTPQRREALIRMIKDRIRVTELQVTDKEIARANGSRAGGANRQGAERKDLQTQLKTIDQLQKDGQASEARRQADELAKRFPQTTATQAVERTASSFDQVDAGRRLQKERERGMVGGLVDVDRSATPPGGDLEFPKDWKQRTKDRSTAVKLTEKEKAILTALNSTLTVNFKNSRLEDVLEYLRTITGLTIILDQEAMREAEVSYDSPVTMSAKGVTVRTVLRKVLNDLGLAYVIRNEVIEATSAQKAKELMVVRRYYVGDLLAGVGVLDTTPAWPLFQARPQVVAPAVAQFQAAQLTQSVKQIIEMIETSVDPQSWRTNGGSGTIFFHAPSMSLVIKQSAEVHARLGTGLAK
jgi:hypothetical protein